MMDKNERKEMEVLHKKPNKTEKETERHKELWNSFSRKRFTWAGQRTTRRDTIIWGNPGTRMD